MDARAPRTTNWATRNLKPPHALEDIELVAFASEQTFKTARGNWMRDLARMGDPAFANMITVCFVASGYMGFAKGAVCTADQHRIAADLGWALSTVRRALDLAEAWGWLTKTRRIAAPNVYRMSFSRSVVARIELEHTNRIKDFEIEATKKRLDRQARRSLRSERMETSGLTDPFAQVWTNSSLRSDALSSPSSSSSDPLHPSTERLGEGAPDIGDELQQKKESADDALNVLDDVLRALGGGDLNKGMWIAERMDEGRRQELFDLVEREGVVGAHLAILDARQSVSPAH